MGRRDEQRMAKKDKMGGQRGEQGRKNIVNRTSSSNGGGGGK
jgi:hypothetical protein